MRCPRHTTSVRGPYTRRGYYAAFSLRRRAGTACRPASSASAAVLEVPDRGDAAAVVAAARDQVTRLALEGRPAPAVTAAGPVLVRQLDSAVVCGLLQWRPRDALGVRGQAACEGDRHVVGVGRDFRGPRVCAKSVHLSHVVLEVHR